MRAAWWCARVGLATMAMLGAVAASAFAQGFYYKEITRDDRIYVFNIAAEAERFETDRRDGPRDHAARDRPERRDGRRRLRAGAPALLTSSTASRRSCSSRPRRFRRIEWRDGKTRITTDLAYLEISNRIQVRYTHDLPRRQLAGPRQAPLRRATRKDRSGFDARSSSSKAGSGGRPTSRPRPAILPRLSYELQLNWPDVTAANAPGNMLEDANIAWDPQGQGQVPRRVRPVQGAVRPPADDVVRQSAVRRSLARLERIRARPRHRSRGVRAPSGATSSSTAPASSTATA